MLYFLNQILTKNLTELIIMGGIVIATILLTIFRGKINRNHIDWSLFWAFNWGVGLSLTALFIAWVSKRLLNHYHVINWHQIDNYYYGILAGTGLCLAIFYTSTKVARYKPKSIEGADSEWSGWADLNSKKFIKNKTEHKYPVGYLDKKMLYTNGHCLIIAPTGRKDATDNPNLVGKTSSLIIPNILMYEHSLVINDVKGELCEITLNNRRKKGRCVVIAPYGYPINVKDSEKANINILGNLYPNKKLQEQAKQLALAFIEETKGGKDKFWTDNPRNILTALIMRVVEIQRNDGNVPTLQNLADIIADAEMFEQVLASFAVSNLKFVKSIDVSALTDNHKASFITTLKQNLEFIFNENFTDYLGEGTFDPAELKDGVTTLYIIIPPTKKEIAKYYLRSIYASIINSLMEHDNQAHHVQIIWEEAYMLGDLKEITDYIGITRSYGIWFTLVYQDLSQIKTTYGDMMNTLISQCSTRLYLSVGDAELRKKISDDLGKVTVRWKIEDKEYEKQTKTQPLMSDSEIMNYKGIIAFINNKKALVKPFIYHQEKQFKKLLK